MKTGRSPIGSASADPMALAIDQLTAALQQDPGALRNDARGSASLNNLGTRLRDEGRLDEAAATYRQALSLRPDNAEAHNNLGTVYDLQGKLSEAVAAYRRAIVLRPDFADTHYNLGNALREQGKSDEAVAAFTSAAALGHQPARHLAAALKGETPDRAPADYVAKLFDGYAAGFESHLIGDLGYRSPQILRTMLEAIEPGRRFVNALDLGCGTGLSGVAFQPIADRITGIDLSSKMIALAAEKGIYSRLQVADIPVYLSNCGDAFDLFTASDVLIYIGALDGLFEAISQRALPDARFAFCAEISQGADYGLAASGRYGHTRAYLEDMVAKIGGRVLAWETHPIRTHQGTPLPGHHAIAALR